MLKLCVIMRWFKMSLFIFNHSRPTHFIDVPNQKSLPKKTGKFPKNVEINTNFYTNPNLNYFEAKRQLRKKSALELLESIAQKPEW